MFEELPTFADASLPPPATKTPKKKRKKEEDDEVRELKQKAKYHCKDIKEWRVISKYNKEKLEQYLNDQSFLDAAQITQHIGTFATNLYGMLLDKMTKSDGFVEEEIKNDLTLKNAIQRELIDYVKHITNRFQIAIFSTVNVINGKKKQQANNSVSSHGQPNLESERTNVDEFCDGVPQSVVETDRSEWVEPDVPSEFADGGGEDFKHAEEEEEVSRID
jgi:hypothetical protein